MENKKFLFNKYNIHLVVKATNEFMAMCYANQYMETRYIARFETYEAIELDNDMDFGVVAAITAGSVEYFTSDHKYYQKSAPESSNQQPVASNQP
jgi:L-serine deaminase